MAIGLNHKLREKPAQPSSQEPGITREIALRPPRDYEDATVVVIELEGEQVYFKIIEPKPEPQRIEKLLRLTIEAWFKVRPQFVVDRTLPVVEEGETLGIQVWYHVDACREMSPSPGPVDHPACVTFELSETILKQFPKEYIEAVIDEAMQVWNDRQEGKTTLAVVNSRRIAVILDGRSNRGAVVPVEAVYDVLDTEARETLLAWLGSIPTRLHVVQIAGSWFEPYDGGWRKGRIMEPRFMRTNMTYDNGKPPGV